MNEKELLEQFVSEVETMLQAQRKYYSEPKDSPMKYVILAQSKAQEKKVRKMVDDYRDEQRRRLEPSLFPETCEAV